MANSFRPDINGLRAWAVIVVILYHFGIPGFSGGFIGVDVFFVISGYLMTRIIVQGLEQKNFSIRSFYLARARRIIPALLVLCFFLLIGGWFTLTPIDYKQLGYHVMASLLFFSNHRFASEAGYFDTASHEKWLLHTWSLSVEWQFYLILPVILVLLWRFFPGRRTVITFSGLALLASLALSVVMTSTKPSDAFYFLSTRAWEMLAGGLVFLLMQKRSISPLVARLAELIGFALIIASTYYLSTYTPWPGAWALMPVIGAVLVLIAARPSSLFTNTRAAQWFGNCSYSLYLWHWPLVVSLVYLEKQHDSLLISCGLILTLLLGWASYRFIENPTRIYSAKLQPKRAGTIITIGVLTVVLLAGWVRLQDGLVERLPEHIAVIAQAVHDQNPRKKECQKNTFPTPECTYGGDQLGAIVIGDSHAGSIMRAVEAALPNTNLHVLDWSMSGCPTVQGLKMAPKDSTLQCPDFIQYTLSKHKNLPQDVPLIVLSRSSAYAYGTKDRPSEFIAIYFGDTPVPMGQINQQHLDAYQNAITDTACELAKIRPVYLVRPTPEMPVNTPNAVARSLMWGKEMRDVTISMSEYHQRNATVWEAQDAAAKRCDVKILDPIPTLCWDGYCRGMKNGRPMYYDDDHLSEYGARLLTPMFETVFTNNQ